MRFTVKGRGFFPMQTGEGTFTLCWFGVAEVWNVTLDDGSVVHVYPDMGEAMERVG